jgi:hypothetical protein
MNIAQTRQVITYLTDAADDLHILERAGVDTGYPQSLINRAIDALNDDLPEEN